jgi:hypothetical protein
MEVLRIFLWYLWIFHCRKIVRFKLDGILILFIVIHDEYAMKAYGGVDV